MPKIIPKILLIVTIIGFVLIVVITYQLIIKYFLEREALTKIIQRLEADSRIDNSNSFSLIERFFITVSTKF